MLHQVEAKNKRGAIKFGLKRLLNISAFAANYTLDHFFLRDNLTYTDIVTFSLFRFQNFRPTDLI